MSTLTDKRFSAQSETILAAQQTTAATKRPFHDDALALRQVLPFAQRVTASGGK